MNKTRLKKIFVYTVGITYCAGLIMREAYKDDINLYVIFGPYKTLARYHLTSFTGGIIAAFLMEDELQKRAGWLGKKFKDFANNNLEETAVMTAGAALTAFEMVSATLPRRSFDWGDMAVYGASLALYYAVAKATKTGLPTPSI